MVYNNIENSDIDDTTLGDTLQFSAIFLSSAVAYARVEAEKHHLSDILLGNAFGAYISDFLYKSFMEQHVDISTTLSMNAHAPYLRITYKF